MAELGIAPPKASEAYETGRGFVTFPEDGTDPIVLSYRDGPRGLGVEHSELVEVIRGAAIDHDLVTYLPYARAQALTGQALTYTLKGGPEHHMLRADRIVGADGRGAFSRRALGLEDESITCSRMAGLLLDDVEVPFVGYGHVFLGGPGPMLCYRILPGKVRLILDIPNRYSRGPKGRATWLWEAFSPALPPAMRPAFRRALREGGLKWAKSSVRRRATFGRRGYPLIGDAIGHYHPLTAAGMTLGFDDAIELAESDSFTRYRLRRARATRVPEMLAVALYEVFTDDLHEALAIRRAVYKMWRESPAERERTMSFLACQEHGLREFSASFGAAVRHAVTDIGGTAVRRGTWRHAGEVVGALGSRMKWLTAGMLHLGETTATHGVHSGIEPEFVSSQSPAGGSQVIDLDAARPPARDDVAGAALERGVGALVQAQSAQGDWEGEVVWCALLAAQYALAAHLMGIPLTETRRQRLIQQFRATQDPSGLWGLHAHSEPYLFVTTLVYVAARLLGVAADDPLLARARGFFEAEGGVGAIPSWGKFWLAMLNLYEWDGVNPVLPEAWSAPTWAPLHPRHYYCHTRLIYMAMSVVYGERYQASVTPTVVALREELFPQGYLETDFPSLRGALRDGDIYTPPSRALKAVYGAARLADRFHNPRRRRHLLVQLRERIRWELETTAHTSISPVSGLLNIIALWLGDPADPTVARALTAFEGWIWEDDEDGLRVAGARSATWDTAFAVQALAQAAPHVDVAASIEQGTAFLRSQQILGSFPGYEDAFRNDPDGGWCFAGVWHGWPVSDCTAEAITALLETNADDHDIDRLGRAANFILRAQNPDGGFGSYEHQKTRLPLEWLNPAEMFGDSMTEHSYIECTASCVAALAAIDQRFPGRASLDIRSAIDRAVQVVRDQQNSDGSWSGVWGVHFTYGTLFGIRGLMAGGVPITDTAIRRACAWLLAHQRADGGWGEHHESALQDTVIASAHSQIIQTSWALAALLEAGEPCWEALERAAGFLAAAQTPEGDWPEEEMAGVFFHTALLHYKLYRKYFPVWSLGLFESRRKGRETALDDALSAPAEAHAASGRHR